MDLLCALLLIGADMDTTTVEMLRVDVRHELYTEIDTVCSRVHWHTGRGVWVRQCDGTTVLYDRAAPIKEDESAKLAEAFR